MPRLDETAKGVYLITVTPFRDDGALDLESTDRLTDFYLDCGVTGFTVLGVMGEAPKLTAEESRTYVKRVLARVNGRVPVIVGVSSPGFAAMGEIAKSVMDLGAAGVMVGPGAAVRTDDQAVAYYEMAAETLGPGTPFCVQDHPLAYAGVQLPVPVLTRIFKSIPTAVMLKHEDWPGPGLAKLSAMRAASDRGDIRRISILAGNGGGLFLPEELSRGADGAMTGFSYPGDDGGRGGRARRRRRRARARPLRRVPAARPLRAAIGPRPRGAQVPAAQARRHRLDGDPQAGPQALRGRYRRYRPPHRSPGQTTQGNRLMALDKKIIDTLSQVTTATLTTLLLKKGLRNVWMRGTRPLNPGQPRLVGPAFTLRFVPAREDLATPESWSKPISTRAAIEAMPEGCIAVADAMGVTDAGIFGDILCARMKKKGVAALVTDGVLRDVAGVRGTGLPVWCQGAAAPPSVAGLTFVNWGEPIGCGGVAVFPDDVVVVDDDGAVLIPQALVEEMVATAPEQERLEGWLMAEVEKGASLPGLYPPNAENKARYEAWKSKS